ncbi:MAG TPA: LysR substrate-binding domain-containing protein, partial [Verrucomicrobiae bacterium]
MNRNHLALFSAVAQAGGISQGAALVRISQPAVSKQIAELESALGVKLLERRPRGCRLTEAGEILAEHARRWLATEQAATRAIAEYRGLQRGCLRIGASLTIGGYLLPKIVAAFHRACPELELQLEIANSDRIHALLAEAAIEIGFTEGPLVNADLATHCFHEDELVGVAPAGHRFLKLPGITVREFVREPLLLREVGSGTRAVVELALRRKGITVRP